MKEKLRQFADARVQNKNQTQGFLYVIIGGYLCYIAYSLIKSYFEESPSIPLWVTVLAAVFFVLFGLAVAALGLYAAWYHTQSAGSFHEQDKDPGESDESPELPE